MQWVKDGDWPVWSRRRAVSTTPASSRRKPFLEIPRGSNTNRFLGHHPQGQVSSPPRPLAKSHERPPGRGGAIRADRFPCGALQAIGATPVGSLFSGETSAVHALVKNLAISSWASRQDSRERDSPTRGNRKHQCFGTFSSRPRQVKNGGLPTFNAMHPLGRNGQPADRSRSAAVSRLRFRRVSLPASFIPVDGGRYGRQAIVGGISNRSSETRDASLAPDEIPRSAIRMHRPLPAQAPSYKDNRDVYAKFRKSCFTPVQIGTDHAQNIAS